MACGEFHTVTLSDDGTAHSFGRNYSGVLEFTLDNSVSVPTLRSLYDDGTVHSFGRNKEGALGLGRDNDVSLPTPIPNLPQISKISCGGNFTVCGS